MSFSSPKQSAQSRSTADIYGTPLAGGLELEDELSPLPRAYLAEIPFGTGRRFFEEPALDRQVRLTSDVVTNLLLSTSPPIAKYADARGRWIRAWGICHLGGQVPQQRSLAGDLKCRADVRRRSAWKGVQWDSRSPTGHRRVQAARQSSRWVSVASTRALSEAASRGRHSVDPQCPQARNRAGRTETGGRRAEERLAWQTTSAR